MCEVKKIDDIKDVLEALLLPNKGDRDCLDSSTSSSFKIWKVLDSNIRAVEQKGFSESIKWLQGLFNLVNDKTNEQLNFNETRWKFSFLCFHVLIELKKKLNSLSTTAFSSVKPNGKFEVLPSAPPDVLSIQFQNLIRKALQFVACLGIASNLLPGVGISLEQRTNLSEFIGVDDGKNIPLSKKQQRLFVCIESLLECMENHFLANLIKTQHLSDLLAALFQITYLPIKYIKESEGITEELLNSLLQERKLCRKSLNDFINNHTNASTVKELFVLQGTKPNSKFSTPPPLWLQVASMKTITVILMKPSGVKHIISGVLDVHFGNKFENEKLDSVDWHKSDVVAKLIGTCPPHVSPKDSYYIEIISQLMELLHIKVEWKNKLSRIINGIITSISLQAPDVARINIFNPLIKPLMQCTNESACTLDYILTDEDSLSRCIEDLHMIFVTGGEPNSPLLKYFLPVWNIVFHIYAFSRKSVSYTRKQSVDLLVYSLQALDVQYSVKLLTGVLISQQLPDEIHSWNKCLCISVGSTGSLKMKFKQSSEDDWLLEEDQKIEAVIDLLILLNNSDLLIEFFLNVHKLLPIILLSTEKSSDDKSVSNKQILLEIEAKAETQSVHDHQSWVLCETITRLVARDELLEKFIDNKLRAIQFVKTILESGVEFCVQNKFLETSAESLNLAMSFLNIIINTSEMNPEIIAELKKIEPHLHILSYRHEDELVQELAKELRIAILTHGIIKPSETNQNTISELSSENRLKGKGQTSDENIKLPKYQEAWLGLNNPEVAVRGFSLLTIRKLIEKKDPEVLQDKAKILRAFMENLKHEDSYVYLNAIQGLATLADKYPDIVIPQLVKEFGRIENLPESRIKVGEVLVKTIIYLGDILPKYRGYFLNAFLHGCKDSDPLLRASSLSNLGEVCKGLKFALGPYVHEIFNCASSILKTDGGVEVRKAAALVINFLLEGLGKNSFLVLDNLLKDIYRVLKQVYETENDDAVKLHVQMALENLDTLTRDFLFPKETMTKKIQILDQL